MTTKTSISEQVITTIRKLGGKEIKTLELISSQDKWIFENVILLKRQSCLTFCTFNPNNRTALFSTSISDITFYDFIQTDFQKYKIILKDSDLIEKWELLINL